MGCYADESSGSSKLIIPAVAALIVFDTAIFFLTIARVGKYSKVDIFNREPLALTIVILERAGGMEGGGRIVNIFFRDGEHCRVLLITTDSALSNH